MTLQEQIRSNRWRTVLIFALFFVLFGLLGGALYLYSGSIGFVGIFGIAMIIYGIVSYFFSGAMVARMTGAKPVSREEYPDLYHLIDEIAISAGLAETPPLYVVQDSAPNAFAAGRDVKHSYVAVTTGLMEIMDKRQLRAVIGHEVAHIISRDVRLMSIATVLVGVIALLSDILLRMTIYGGRGRKGNAFTLVIALVAAIIAPIAAMAIQMAISRRREFLADARSIELTGDAEAMASALAQLSMDTRVIKKQDHATAHMYIESPTHQEGYKMGLKGMFDTHPPLEDRIAAIEKVGGFTLASSPK